MKNLNLKLACGCLVAGMSTLFLKRFIVDFNWTEVVQLSVQAVGLFLLTKYVLKPSWLVSEKSPQEDT